MINSNPSFASMADQCIVCLEDLDIAHPITTATELPDQDHAGPSTASIITTNITQPGKLDDDDNNGNGNEIAETQLLALIKPCGHVLHDECLREWSQKANSCPICRRAFNLVEVLDGVGGTVLSEYTVEDKKQVAEFDANAWIEDNLEEEETNPCPICGESDQEDVLLLCDGCDAPYHTHCIGIDAIPSGNWFCMECAEDGAYARAAEPMQTARRGQSYSGRTQPRTQASVRRTRRRMRTDHWYGAWSMFSSRVHDAVGLDLDFSEDDQYMAGYRVHQRRSQDERRERANWQRRLEIIGRLGGQTAREEFRNVAPILREQPPKSPVETAEEAQAWSALERAKELDTVSPRGRKRKAKSATASPSEPAESKEPERKLKRPRTRRVLDTASSSAASPTITSRAGSTSNRAGSPMRPTIDTSAEPSFLSSLLREVETATSEEDTPRPNFGAAVRGPMRVTSPSTEFSSPGASPSPPPSTYHTPRAMSITPPPHITKRPGSPLPLTSRIEPFYHAEYPRSRSPPQELHLNTATSPQNQVQNHESAESSTVLELRQPRPRRRGVLPLARSPDQSPARSPELPLPTSPPPPSNANSATIPPPLSSPRTTMTFEAKENISALVKSALAPHWKAADITKEQYAEINQKVSRKLYGIVGCEGRGDEGKGMGAWELIAAREVGEAVKGLSG